MVTRRGDAELRASVSFGELSGNPNPKQTETAGMRRLSKLGTLTLGAVLYAAFAAFDRTLYGDALRSGSLAASSFVTLNGLVLALSFLNALSHIVVCSGALGGRKILTIAIGVAFDVLARTVQLVWWIEISLVALVDGVGGGIFEAYVPTLCLSAVPPIILVYHVMVNVQVLQTVRRMRHYSYLEVVDILCAALKNLRGSAGGGMMHRIFAFSNLGGHVAPLCLAGYLLHQQDWLIPWSVASVLSLIAVRRALSTLPTLGTRTNKSAKDAETSLLSIRKGRIDCRCDACSLRSEDTGGNCCAFTFSGDEGVCRLWRWPFEELSDTLLVLAFHAE